MKKIYIWPWPLFLLTLSSAFFAASFAPWHLWPLGFFSLVFIFILLEKQIPNKRTAIAWGFILGLATDIFAYSWILYTMMVFGHLPALPAALLFIAYAFFTNLRFGFFFLGVYFWQKKSYSPRTFSMGLLFAVFWYFSERFVWQLFPWYGGNLVSGNLLFIQIVDVVGIYGASFFWFLANYFMYLLLALGSQKLPSRYHLNPGFPLPWTYVSMGFVLILAIHLYGFFAMKYWDGQYSHAPKKIVGIAQGNTPLSFAHVQNMRDFLNETTTNMVDQTIRLHDVAVRKHGKLDLVIWPESAVPFLKYNQSDFLRKEIGRMYESIHSEFVFNDILDKYVFIDNKYIHKSYSNVWFFNAEGKITASYQKNYPLPFGEYIPLGSLFPVVYDIMPEVSNFDASGEVSLFMGNTGNILPSICYETILPGFIWDFQKQTGRKAQMIVNLTNDTWFGDTIETYEHLELAKIRATEYRLPLLRAVNSGVSGYIDYNGRLWEPTEKFTRVSRIYAVPVLEKSRKTVYAMMGNYTMDILTLLLAGFLFFREWKSRRNCGND